MRTASLHANDKTIPPVARTVALLALAVAVSAAPTLAQPAGEWHNYAADSRSSKYSPLDQIDKTNVHQLEIAWRWKSIDYGLAAQHEGIFPPFLFQNTPMMRDGRVLVATGIGAAALDPASGEILWTYDPFEDEAPRNMGRLSVRGGVTWNDGSTRRLFFVGNGRLTALDADTGARDPEFGDGGRIDMLDAGQGVRRRQYFWTSAPVVCGDVIVLGESTSDAWSRRNNPPGMIRGYDARSGALRWRFNIIPAPGEFGHDTWDSPEAAQAGAANVWTWMSCDQELGMVYAATSTPSNDWYGGHRPGKGLFAESILALDAESGERQWHFQAVHHGLWDFDFPAAPVLADIVVDGKAIRALAQPSKQAFLYVFDRETGDYEWATLPNGLPITKPPYGRLTAIDLDTGEHLWMVPNGDGPRDHPALAHLDLPPLGQQGRVSALVTKTLVFLADGSDAMVVQPEGAGSRKFRAYDKTNGEAVWELDLPAGVSGAPMTYLHEGRQYIVMAISGVGFEGELLALALPESPAAAAP